MQKIRNLKINKIYTQNKNNYTHSAIYNIVINKFLNTDTSSFTKISQVIKLMNDINLVFEKVIKYKNISCFLYTYLIVTKKVYETNLTDKTYFNNFSLLQKLDIKFAHEFFIALKMYLNNDYDLLKNTAWNTYFNYIQRNDSIAIVNMLLGINAHINGDLAISLIKNGVNDFEDFLKINKILINVTPKILIYLIKNYHDLFSALALMFPLIANFEFKKTIVLWRSIAFENYKILQKSSKLKNKNIIYKQTNLLGIKIINTFHTKNLINFILIPIKMLNVKPKILF